MCGTVLFMQSFANDAVLIHQNGTHEGIGCHKSGTFPGQIQATLHILFIQLLHRAKITHSLLGDSPFRLYVCSMNWQEQLQQLCILLEPIYGESEAAAMSLLVVEHVSGIDRKDRQRYGQLKPDQAQYQQLEAITAALLRQEPLQYVLGEAWFYGMRMQVNKNVLIPRPETEELVDWTVREEREREGEIRVLDIGTGSGCIALGIKKGLPGAEVMGMDISEGALELARENARLNGMEVAFIQADALTVDLRLPKGLFQVLVSNPPYIPLKDLHTLPYNVAQFEPHLALFVDSNDPLLFYRKIARMGRRLLQKGGALYFEIHELAGKEILALLEAEGYRDIELRKDLQGKDRMVRARNPE